jgi:hypothetical protein
MNLMVKDKDGNPSLSATIFLYGSLICGIKLLLSGVNFHSLFFPVFNGGDFAVAISALGGVHGLNKHVDNIARDN